MPWDEDRLHRWLRRELPSPAIRGSHGHDAAVLTRPKGREVACTDQVVAGVHFDSDASPRQVGRKAAMRAVSDLAATAAKPRALLLAIRAPRELEEKELRDWVRGVSDVGLQFDAHLCGGDISCSPGPASLCVTALGEYLGAGRPPGRDRARVGDLVLLTGAVGGSRLGRHLRFEARVEAGQILHHKFGARALMDVSDGLAWDLYRLVRSSGVRARLKAVPLHADCAAASREDGLSSLSHALHDGEDHELLAVMSPANARAALRSRARSLGGLSIIGEIESGAGLVLDGELLGARSKAWRPGDGGWRHGV